MTNATCTTPDCANKLRIAGLCDKHYRHRLYADRVCVVDDCGKTPINGTYCKAHSHQVKRGTLGKVTPSITERFAARVTVLPNGCWKWCGPVDEYGYGLAHVSRQLPVHAHRVAYILSNGNIPSGATIDHLCHLPDSDCPSDNTCAHRLCVNPDHLGATSLVENVMRGNGPTALNARKTHCIHGHEFSAANTQVNTRGHRRCRACMRTRSVKR